MPKLDEYSYHEAMDRACVAMELFNSSVQTHPVTESNPELKKGADDVMELLYGFYAKCAEYTDKKERATEYVEAEE